jgi:choice-of-anchor A domain-containing protein
VTTPRKLLPALLTLSALAASADTAPFACSTCGSGFNASAFNVVTLGTGSTGLGSGNAGNFSPNSDIGGGIAVFGSYSGNGYAVDQQYTNISNPYTDRYALIVNGSITTSGTFTMGSGNSLPVWVGGTYTGFNGTQPTVVKPPTASDFDFTAARTSLENLSDATLANYATAVTGTPVSNGTNYVLTPTGTGLLVYNINFSYFTNQNLGFEVDLSAGQSVVINVTGASSSLTISKGTFVKLSNGSMVNANTQGGVPVLFNFPEVTSLKTSSGIINGSILAPFATFNSANQDVDGQIIVASVSGLAETHNQYYDGSLPSLALIATPEPASVFLFGGALIAMGLIRRKSA